MMKEIKGYRGTKWEFSLGLMPAKYDEMEDTRMNAVYAESGYKASFGDAMSKVFASGKSENAYVYPVMCVGVPGNLEEIFCPGKEPILEVEPNKGYEDYLADDDPEYWEYRWDFRIHVSPEFMKDYLPVIENWKENNPDFRVEVLEIEPCPEF